MFPERFALSSEAQAVAASNFVSVSKKECPLVDGIDGTENTGDVSSQLNRWFLTAVDQQRAYTTVQNRLREAHCNPARFANPQSNYVSERGPDGDI